MRHVYFAISYTTNHKNSAIDIDAMNALNLKILKFFHSLHKCIVKFNGKHWYQPLL